MILTRSRQGGLQLCPATRARGTHSGECALGPRPTHTARNGALAACGGRQIEIRKVGFPGIESCPVNFVQAALRARCIIDWRRKKLLLTLRRVPSIRARGPPSQTRSPCAHRALTQLPSKQKHHHDLPGTGKKGTQLVSLAKQKRKTDIPHVSLAGGSRARVLRRVSAQRPWGFGSPIHSSVHFNATSPARQPNRTRLRVSAPPGERRQNSQSNHSTFDHSLFFHTCGENGYAVKAHSFHLCLAKSIRIGSKKQG